MRLTEVRGCSAVFAPESLIHDGREPFAAGIGVCMYGVVGELLAVLLLPPSCYPEKCHFAVVAVVSAIVPAARV